MVSILDIILYASKGHKCLPELPAQQLNVDLYYLFICCFHFHRVKVSHNGGDIARMKNLAWDAFMRTDI